MKKLITCLLVVAVGLFTIGCGGDAKKPTEPSKPAGGDKTGEPK